MTIQRLASTAFWIVIASAAAAGQQKDEAVRLGPDQPATSSIERTSYTADGTLDGTLPWRRVETRSASGTREIVTEMIETPDIDGRWRTFLETSTETTRSGPDAVQTNTDVFGFAPAGRRLLETTRSARETLANGVTRTVQDTWVPDLNGRLSLMSRQVVSASASAGTNQTDTSVLRPGTEGFLQELEVARQTGRQSQPDLVRRDSTLLTRDVNGRLQPAETRSREVRTIGPSEFVEEETVQRPGISGNLVLSERYVTRRSQANGQEQIVTEIFSSDIQGLRRSENRLDLSQRVRRTTMSAADGSGRIVEEIEERVPGSPNEPVRVVQRTIETIRRVDPAHWESELQIFGRDLNGQLVLIAIETGAATER